MKNSIFLLILIHLTIFKKSNAQESIKSNTHIRVSGRIVDSKTNNSLPFASIRLSKTDLGFISNEDGEFRLSVESIYTNDTLVFSYVGFKNLRVAVKDLNEQFTTVRLTESIFDLESVEVNPLRAIDIVKKAITKIGQNYQSKPAILDTYYRELVKVDSLFVQFADANCRLYYTAYNISGDLVKSWSNSDKSTGSLPFSDIFSDKIKQGDQQQVIQSRKSNNWQEVRSIFKQNNINFEQFDIPGAALSLSSMDNVKLLNTFLDSLNFDFYHYELEESIQFDDKYCYKIYFKPKKKNIELSFLEGYLLIDKESFAFTSFEYEIPKSHERLLEKANTLELKIRGSKNEYKDDADRKTHKRLMTDYYHRVKVTYRQFENVWYLSSILKKSRYKNSGSHFNEIIFETNSELIVSSIKTQSVYPISKENQFNGFLFHYPSKYNPEFWLSYNTIKASGTFSKALEEIEKKQALDEQFGTIKK
ncbi:MAG: hypothetical protein COW03_15075 [Cytophagales bacterium CG12_big_fil_rev_8_21_14_0_65_40_12]|nr:MAG: hypothetical protein COW03_15075 [Cytophagales bacterium CG12_big_fil_rev_8_21_14_0_65_40_12]PIW05178.1 MAG: hypothetical protein COW40_05875 [Cytophagales bacterium CG17_big_fil_post_rev_8_21_14_2_50_40_13]